MSVQGTRRWLWVGVTAMAAVAVGAIAWAIGLPVDVPVTATPTMRGDVSGQQVSSSDDSDLALPPMERFASVWSVPIRRPLYDPPPPPPPKPRPRAKRPPPPPPPPPPRLSVKLTGTAVEDDPSMSTAIFTTREGKTQIVRVAGVLEDGRVKAVVERVDQETVTLKVAGRDLVLELETPQPGRRR